MMLMPAGVYTGYVVALAWISNTLPRPPAKVSRPIIVSIDDICIEVILLLTYFTACCSSRGNQCCLKLFLVRLLHD